MKQKDNIVPPSKATTNSENDTRTLEALESERAELDERIIKIKTEQALEVDYSKIITGAPNLLGIASSDLDDTYSQDKKSLVSAFAKTK